MSKRKQTSGTKDSCECSDCRSACSHKPGWFKPGEAERVAQYLGVLLEDLFRDKLAVDWWVGSPSIFLLSPALIGEPSGTEFPGDPRGKCVFYQDGRCSIHAVKPFECHEVVACDDDQTNYHKVAAMAWDKPEHQAQIATLLGREPVEEDSPNLFSLFGM